MGTIKNFTQQKAFPFPIGIPPLVYVPYDFGQMKPIPLEPNIITLSIAFQWYLRIFIPANSWGDDKLLYMHARIAVEVKAPNQPGGPNYLERYQIPTVTTVQRGPLTNVTLVPSNTEFEIRRVFIKPPGNVIKEINWDAAANYAVSNPDGIDHQINFVPTIGPFDPTIDNYMNFEMTTTFPASTDRVICRSGQAYIQSPLDLRRLPR